VKVANCISARIDAQTTAGCTNTTTATQRYQRKYCMTIPVVCVVRLGDKVVLDEGIAITTRCNERLPVMMILS